MASKRIFFKTFSFLVVVLLGIGILVFLFLENNAGGSMEAGLHSPALSKTATNSFSSKETTEKPERIRLLEKPHLPGGDGAASSLEAALLLRGTVRDPGGKGICASVAVFQSEEEAGEESKDLLVLGKAGKDGTFSIRFQAKKAQKVDILALFKGYKPGWTRGLSLAELPRKVEFVLTRGDEIAGRIHTVSGRPLAGIQVLACASSFTSRPRTFVSSNMLERDLKKTPHIWKKGYHQASGITDEDGRFRIQGLENGEYAILIKSYRWILDPPIRVEAGADNVNGTAKRALSLKARVLDAETSEPVNFIAFDIQIIDRKAVKKFEIGGACLNGNLQVGWIPKWRLLKIPYPVLVSLFSPDYFQHRETLYLWKTLAGPPPKIYVKPIHRAPVLFKAVYKEGTPMEYPVLMVDFCKPGKKPPIGRAEARLLGKGLYQVRLPEGKNEVRVFRPRMKVQWPRNSWPLGEWTVPGKGPYEVVFSKGATLRLHLSPETMGSLENGRMVLWMEGSRKKDAHIEFGSQVSLKKFKGKTLTIRDVPPGIFLRFSLKKSLENDHIIRASRLFWIEEGSEVDFFL